MSDDQTSSATDPESSGSSKPNLKGGGKPIQLHQLSKPSFKPKPKQDWRKRTLNSKAMTPRHGGATYAKEKTNGNGLLTTAVRPYFPVFVSTLGCDSFVRAVYNWCIGRDYRFGASVPLYMLQYATTIAFYARLAIVNETIGLRIDSLTSRLKSVSKGLLLPECICKMIEAVGVVQRPGFPTVAPIFPTWEQVLDSPVLADPSAYLDQSGRQIPDTPWAIDTEYLAEYINHCARGESRNLGFRMVDYDSREGKVEMLYGYMTAHKLFPGDLVPAGPSQSLQSEAELGAAYCFRDHDRSDLWISGANHLVSPDFVGSQFAVSTFVARLAGEHSRNPRQ